MKSKLTKLITVVDHERTWTIDLVPRIHDSEIGEKEKAAHESSEARDHEGSWPTVIVHGHIKEEA
jgi:hypothetical protein